MKKRHLFLTALAAVAIMLCSCVSEMEISVEQVYSVGVFESEFTPNDSVLVLKYLQDKACPLGGITMRFKSDSMYGCDSACNQAMADITQRLSVAELDSLPLSDNCRFKYAAARYGHTYPPPYETIVVYVGAFDYQRKK